MVNVLSEKNSIFNHFLAEIRDQKIQTDALRFRKNMERMSEVMAYEISKTFHYNSTSVTTPLGKTNVNLMTHQPVIASILRAGLSMHNGFLNYFDQAENAFVSAYRENTTDGTVSVKVEYMACPDLTDKTLIVIDPMLATGESLKLTHKSLLDNGTPKRLIIAAIIASQHAINVLTDYFAEGVEIWVGAIDPDLNEKSYIVPGLGDAGDLAYGPKKTP